MMTWLTKEGQPYANTSKQLLKITDKRWVQTKEGKLLLEILRNTRLQALVSKNPPRRLPSVLSPVSWNTNNNDGLRYDSVFYLFLRLC